MKSQYKNIVLFIILLSTMALFSCSSSDNNSISVPVFAPKSMQIVGKHEEFTVQFSKIAGIGSKGYEELPVFEFLIGETNNVSEAKSIGSVAQPDDRSGLMRLFIKPKKTEDDGTNTVFEYPLVDGREYSVFLRACYTSYGCSSYLVEKAIPIPYPQKMEGVKVEIGDKNLYLSWKKQNNFDEYGILIGDDCNSPKLPRFTPKYVTSNSEFLITGLENSKAYPVCIRSQNINTNVDNPATIIWIQPGDYTPLAAEVQPHPFNISLVKESNKRVVIKWQGDFTGKGRVTEYKVEYTSGSVTKEEPVVVTTKDIEHTIVGLENGKKYSIKVKAVNSIGTVFSNTIEATPNNNEPIDFNNPDTVLGKSGGLYIFAENIPHSDFWRINPKSAKGGRPNSDMLPRGKETALGNLFADGINFYAKENIDKNIDFTFITGGIILNGIDNGASLTPRFLMSIIHSDFIDDTLAIVSIKGEHLISQLDYKLDLNNYKLGVEGYGETLFGQAASVFRNGHYGTGAGAGSYATKMWGIPSSEVKYTIEYLPYDLEKFKKNYDEKRAADTSKNDNLYDRQHGPGADSYYLLPYDDFYYPEINSIGYIRGRIKQGSLLINGKPVEKDKVYKIVTTKSIADTMYIAFLKADGIQYTDIPVYKALGEYIYDKGIVKPYLDGRITLEGGVPGDKSNDYKK